MAQLNPKVVRLTGFACPSCDRFWGGDDKHAEDAARYCCAIRPCQTCGGPGRKHFLRCAPCQERADQTTWEAAKRVPLPARYMINVAAEHEEEWFETIRDFLQYCAREGMAPWQAHPYLAEWRPASAPNLLESCQDDLAEGDRTYPPAWLMALQADVNAEFADHAGDFGAFWVKPGEGDEAQVPEGLPNTPEEWLDWLIAERVAGFEDMTDPAARADFIAHNPR